MRRKTMMKTDKVREEKDNYDTPKITTTEAVDGVTVDWWR
jgi:hypothetical protein